MMNILGQINQYLEKRSRRSINLLKNVAGVTIIRYSSYLLEFLKVPVLLSYLDNEKYGVWLTIVSILLWTNNFDLGLGSGLRYEFTKSLAKGDKQRCKILVSTAYFSMGCIMLVVFLFIGGLSLFLNWNAILNVNTISNKELLITVLSVLFIFILRFIVNLIQTLLLADQRATISSVFMPIGTVFSLICIIIIKNIYPNSLLLASVSMALPYLFILILANLYFFSHEYSQFRPSLTFVRLSVLKDIYSLGFKFFVSQFSTLIVFSTSNILIAQLLSPSDVTTYNIARQYFYLPITFISTFLVSFSAPITEAFVKGDMEWIRRVMEKLKKIAFVLSCCVLVMLLISNIVFQIWTGGRIHIPLTLSVAFAIYAIMNMYASPYGEFLGGVGKFTVRMYVSFFKILVFLPVSIFCIRHWQLEGLVLAICVINTAINIIFGEIQYRKIINGNAIGIWNK